MQQEVIYETRNEVLNLNDEEIIEYQKENLENAISIIISNSIESGTLSSLWPIEQTERDVKATFPLSPDLTKIVDENPLITKEELEKEIVNYYWHIAETLKKNHPECNFSNFYRQLALKTIDDQWKSLMLSMSELREGIHLSG